MYSCRVRAEARGRHHQPSFQFFICKKTPPKNTNNASEMMISGAKCPPTPSEGADVRRRSVSNHISCSQLKTCIMLCIIFYFFLMKMLCSNLFTSCMGCESIMNKAILGSARHSKCTESFFFLLFSNVWLFFLFTGFICFSQHQTREAGFSPVANKHVFS